MYNQFLAKCTEITKSRANSIQKGSSVMIARTLMLTRGFDLPDGVWTCFITVDMPGGCCAPDDLVHCQTAAGLAPGRHRALRHLPHLLSHLPLHCCSLEIIWIRQQHSRCYDVSSVSLLRRIRKK